MTCCSSFQINFSTIQLVDLIEQRKNQQNLNDYLLLGELQSWIGAHEAEKSSAEYVQQLNDALVVCGGEGLLSCCACLLSEGACVDARSSLDGSRTPVLGIAAVRGHEEIVELLIDEGADVAAVDLHNRDSLELARNHFQGPFHIIQPILDRLENQMKREIKVKTGHNKVKVKQCILLKTSRRIEGLSRFTALEITTFIDALMTLPAPCPLPEALEPLRGNIVPLYYAAHTPPLLLEGTRKLHSYALYRRLGSPRHIVAPMVDASELPFRLLCRQYAAHAAWSPMLHSVSFVTSKKYRRTFFTTCPDDVSVVAQFCANQPAVFLQATRILHAEHPNVLAVDLNCGCPQRIAQRGFFGSFLQDDMALTFDLVSTIARDSPLPITVKIRILEDEAQTVAYARMIECAGAAMITVHGRTRKMKDHRKGHADWHIIRKVRDALTIPVVANGSVSTFEDIQACFDISGADAVMSATGLLANPAHFLPPAQQPSRWEIAREYLRLATQHTTRAEFIMRDHLFKMFYIELEVHRDLFSDLVRAHDAESMLRVIDALQVRLTSDPLSSEAISPSKSKKSEFISVFSDDEPDGELFGNLFE